MLDRRETAAASELFSQSLGDLIRLGVDGISAEDEDGARHGAMARRQLAARRAVECRAEELRHREVLEGSTVRNTPGFEGEVCWQRPARFPWGGATRQRVRHSSVLGWSARCLRLRCGRTVRLPAVFVLELHRPRWTWRTLGVDAGWRRCGTSRTRPWFWFFPSRLAGGSALCRWWFGIVC